MGGCVKEEKKGIVLGVFAYVLWGIIPLYWKLLGEVQSLSILFYRIVWSFVFMLLYIICIKKWRAFCQEVKSLFSSPKTLGFIVLAAIFISINWFTFIYSVGHGHVTAASLGYYMNPLVNVLLGTVFLKEKLGRIGTVACCCAAVGVLMLVLLSGEVPIASLVMAISFSLYGFVKKQLVVSSYTSLTIETLIMLPVALLYFVFFSPQPFMGYTTNLNLLLMGAGIVTAIPLMLFAEAAKRISYILLGFIQYVNPTMMLLFAIFLFHEPYTLGQFFAFSFIWLGIVLFTYGTIQSHRKEKQFLSQGEK